VLGRPIILTIKVLVGSTLTTKSTAYKIRPEPDAPHPTQTYIRSFECHAPTLFVRSDNNNNNNNIYFILCPVKAVPRWLKLPKVHMHLLKIQSKIRLKQRKKKGYKDLEKKQM
jgi:hypothetical protein